MPGLRINAGLYKGRRLKTLKGQVTRPTSDKVRAAMFDLLGPVTGLTVIDLFAGSGALGLEALSRGAVEATAVDRSPAALEIIRANAQLLQADLNIVHSNLGNYPPFFEGREPVDLIMADPPYRQGWPERIAGQLPPGALAPGGRLLIESDVQEPPPARTEILDLWKQRRYGSTLITIFITEAA